MTTVLIRDAYDLRRVTGEATETLMPELRRGDTVFLKPNLTYPRHWPGVTTSPDFIRTVLEVFAERGVRCVIGESDGGYGAWEADIAFATHDLNALSKRFGARLVNLSRAPRKEVVFETAKGHLTLALPGVLEDHNAFITLPVPKLHAITLYSGAVKNQWGCIPDTMRLKRHPDFVDLIWAINRHVRARYVLADARYMLDVSGPMSGDPVFMNRFLAGDDILAFDITVMRRVMDMDPDAVGYLKHGRSLGFHWAADVVDDSATGLRHRFELKRTPRQRVVGFAFTRQWAIDLLWDSKIGDLAHTVMYAITGNRIVRERERIQEMAASARGAHE